MQALTGMEPIGREFKERKMAVSDLDYRFSNRQARVFEETNVKTTPAEKLSKDSSLAPRQGSATQTASPHMYAS
jgi:hypothetical protein